MCLKSFAVLLIYLAVSAAIIVFPYWVIVYISSPVWSTVLWSFYGIIWFFKAIMVYDQLKEHFDK